jgi:hypothetical protein
MTIRRDDDLIASAVGQAAPLVPTPRYQRVKTREQRLRLALSDVLLNAGVEVGLLYQPEMCHWPWRGRSKLGHFDLAIAERPKQRPAIVCELKWSTHTGVNALDEVMWDVLKLAHARHSLPDVRSAYLVYAAPRQAWDLETARFRDLFAGTDLDTRAWLDGYLDIAWRWCVREGSKSRPVLAPGRLRTCPVTQTPVPGVPGDMEVRVASVDADWNTPVHLDENAEPIPVVSM